MPASDASPAVAVERALNILEAAADRRDGMTNSEISRKLELPKSTTSVLLSTLESMGYVTRDAGERRYLLTSKAFGFCWRKIIGNIGRGQRRCDRLD